MPSPMRSILGEDGTPPPTSCRIVIPDQVEVHWYTSFAEGAPCFCGKRTYKAESGDDDA